MKQQRPLPKNKKFDFEWLRRRRSKARQRAREIQDAYPITEDPWIDLGGEG